MPEEKKNFKRLSQYAVIMILAAVIIIIIAAMADDREENYENQIYEKEQTNMSIQNEIVKVKDENYSLGKEKEALTKETTSLKAANEQLEALNQGWMLYYQENYVEAFEAIKNIKVEEMSEEYKANYTALYALVEEKNQEIEKTATEQE